MSEWTTGAELARAYFEDVVQPLLDRELPGLELIAGRLGAGSDVLGYDDETSRDHDWGLRLSVLVPADDVARVDAVIEAGLPDEFAGLPTRFAFSGEIEPRHHVDVDSLDRFLESRFGCDPRRGMNPADWLSLTGQSVLEATAGPIFRDDAGEMVRVRRLLEWYPDDIWRHVLASEWLQITEELPLMSRAGDVGDELGSTLIASRIAHATVRLTFLAERRWPPYAKWLGTAFAALPASSDVARPLERAQRATSWRERQQAIAEALDAVLALHRSAGLTTAQSATIPFWDRPYLHPDPAIAEHLRVGIDDVKVRELPPGLGSIEQRSDSVRLLLDPRARRAAVGAD